MAASSELVTLAKQLLKQETIRDDYTPETVHFFRREFSYACFGFQAVVVADEFFRTREGLRTEQGLDCLDVSRKLLSKIAALLFEQRLRICVWHKPSSGAVWEKRCEASHSSFDALEEELGDLERDCSSSCFSACVAVSKTDPASLGVAVMSTVVHSLSLFEFKDDADYLRLRALLMRYGVTAVQLAAESQKPEKVQSTTENDEPSKESRVFPATTVFLMHKLKKMDFAVEILELQASEAKRRQDALAELETLRLESSSEDTVAALEDLSRFNLALDAIAALLRLRGTSDARKCFRVEAGLLDEALLFDKNVTDALQVFPSEKDLRREAKLSNESSSGTDAAAKATCLFSLLNATRTKMGARLLREWLQHPLRDRASILDRQRAIERLVKSPQQLNMLRDSKDFLKNFPDMERMALKLRKTSAIAHAGSALKDMLELYKCTTRCCAVAELMNSIEKDTQSTERETRERNRLTELCSSFKRFEALFEALIDSDHMQRMSFNPAVRNAAANSSPSLVLHKDRYCRVRPSFSAALNRIHGELLEVENKIAAHHVDLQKTVGHEAKDLHLEDSEVHGIHLRVTKRLSTKILKSLQTARIHVDILSNQKAGVLFVTSPLKSLLNKFNSLRERYQNEQRDIVQQALEVVQSYTVPALLAAKEIALVDVTAALAFKAMQSDWIRPEIIDSVSPSHRLSIKNLRHPLLEEQLGPFSVVANDVEVPDDRDFVQIITGPNMGGKSTYMRSIGAAVLLTQIGSFIPAISAEMPLFDRLFVRSGSADCSSFGISSFMAEMVDAADILRNATERSLVLIDELGRGTSTADGFGIAWAILEELALRNRSTVFCATHFHELNQLSEAAEPSCRTAFKPLFVEAKIDEDLKTVSMLYKVHTGECNRSYGINVAKIANFPKEIIDKAQAIEDRLTAEIVVESSDEPGRKRVKLSL